MAIARTEAAESYNFYTATSNVMVITYINGSLDAADIEAATRALAESGIKAVFLPFTGQGSPIIQHFAVAK